MKLRDAVIYVVASMCLAACLDLSPVRYVAKDAGSGTDDDAGAADAAMSDAAPDNYVEECTGCLMTMCGMAAGTCFADAKCGSLATCMTETKCWNEKIVDFNNAPMCIMDCSAKAGIASQVDPALGMFIPMLVCSQQPSQCAAACAPVYLQ